MTTDSRPTLHDDPWLASLARPVLIAVLVLCLDVALLSFVRFVAPGVSTAYTGTLLALGALSAIVGCVTTTWLGQPGQRAQRGGGLRAAEIALLLGATRVALWTVTASWPSPGLLIERPLEMILDGPFVVGAIVVLLSWFFASDMTASLLQLALQSDEVQMLARAKNKREAIYRGGRTDRQEILRNFVGRWITGGLLLILLASASQVGPSPNGLFAIARQNVDPAVIGASIVYFLVGLALLSQGQLALLRARWTLEETPSNAAVLRAWPLYAVGLIGVVGLLAALLPFGDTFLLARVMEIIIYGIYFFVTLVFQLLLGLFLLPFGLLNSEEPPPPEAPPPVEAAPPPEILPPAEPLLPAWTGGALFWVTMFFLLGAAAYIYFSGRGVRFDWLHRLLAALRLRWQHVTDALAEWQPIRQTDESNEVDEPTRDRQLSRRQLRNLTPTQRARYLYFAMLDWAAERDVPRREGETPLRFEPRLGQSLPAGASSPDQAGTQPESPQTIVHTLTDIFIRLRYAGGATDHDAVGRLEQMWKRLQRVEMKAESETAESETAEPEIDAGRGTDDQVDRGSAASDGSAVKKPIP